MIQVDAPYWTFAFPSTILVVWGADFIFATGALFVSCVAREDEQSVAGGIFQTCSQVCTCFGFNIPGVLGRVSCFRPSPAFFYFIWKDPRARH